MCIDPDTSGNVTLGGVTNKTAVHSGTSIQMARLKRRENLIPFVLIFGLGFMAVGVIPPMFADQIVEVPSFVVIPAEIAISLIMSVLLFETQAPPISPAFP
jgi:hypothetical protein